MRRCELIGGTLLLLAAGCTCRDPSRGDPHRDGPSGADAVLPDSTAEPPDTTETGGSALAWVMLDDGYRSACGLLSDGRTVCWGDEFVADVGSRFRQISISGWSGCGLRFDGGVECWCMNPAEPGPCNQVPTGREFVSVQNGEYWACAQDTDRQLHCWGGWSRETPTEPVSDWSIEIEVGCAVFDDGRVGCWGDTRRFGQGTPQPATEPPPELKYTQVAVGRTHACALDTEGEAHCWGRTGYLEPYPAAPPGPWVSLTAWNQVTCGLRADGTAECWYLAPGLMDTWSIADEQWAQIGLGEWAGCGLTVDGRGVCFGMPQGTGLQAIVPDLEDL